MCVKREREGGRGRKGKDEKEKRKGVENISKFTATESRGPKTASVTGPCLFFLIFVFFSALRDV